MTENVSGVGKGLPASTNTRSAGDSDQKTSASRTSGAAERADSNELTSSSRLLQRLADRAASADPVDANRVEAIRSAIAEGRFSVDSEQAAARLLEFERLLDSD